MKCLLLLTVLFGCNSGNNEKTMLFECKEQNQGEACFKLGNARQGEEALTFYRLGCEKENVNSCSALVKLGANTEIALKSLKVFCDRGNKNACGKLAQPKAP